MAVQIEMPGYIYLIGDPEARHKLPIKIGLSRDPSKRVEQIRDHYLGLTHHRNLEVLHSFATCHPKADESWLHHFYGELRIGRSEWFNLDELHVGYIEKRISRGASQCGSWRLYWEHTNARLVVRGVLKDNPEAAADVYSGRYPLPLLAEDVAALYSEPHMVQTYLKAIESELEARAQEIEKFGRVMT